MDKQLIAKITELVWEKISQVSKYYRTLEYIK